MTTIDKAREIASRYTKDTHDRESLALAVMFMVDDALSQARAEIERKDKALAEARGCLQRIGQERQYHGYGEYVDLALPTVERTYELINKILPFGDSD